MHCCHGGVGPTILSTLNVQAFWNAPCQVHVSFYTVSIKFPILSESKDNVTNSLIIYCSL